MELGNLAELDNDKIKTHNYLAIGELQIVTGYSSG
jgi:hypothetical protein